MKSALGSWQASAKLLPQLLLLPPPLFATYHLVVKPLCTSEASTCGCAAPSCPVRYALSAALQSLIGRRLTRARPGGSVCRTLVWMEVPLLILGGHQLHERAAVVTEAVNSSSANTALPDNAAPLLSAN